MAGTESVRPLPPLNPPPKQTGSFAEPGSDARRSPSLSGSGEPLSRPEDFDNEATRVPGGFSPESTIDEQIEDLERWALANLKRDRNEKIRFWTLRGLALLGAAGAAIGGGLGHAHVAVVLGAISAFSIAIDSAWPGGVFKNPHQRAVHDLRELQNTLKLRWDKVRLAHGDPSAPQRIAHALALLDAVQAKREEIGKYLGTSEPSPGVGRRF